MSGVNRLAAADVALGEMTYEEAFSPENLRSEKGTDVEERAEGEFPKK